MTEDMSTLVDRMLDVWRRTPADDAEAAAAFAEVYADPLTVNGAPMTVTGLLARARAVHSAFDDLNMELLDLVTAPERVVIGFVMRGRHTGPLNTQYEREGGVSGRLPPSFPGRSAVAG